MPASVTPITPPVRLGAPNPTTPTPGATSRVAVLLAGVRRSSEDADRWLVHLRWVAIAGMTATVIVARWFVRELDDRPLFILLALIAILNVVWTMVVDRSRRDAPARAGRGADAHRLESAFPAAAGASPQPRFVEGQIVGDVLALTAMLWFAGGVHNPFAAFLGFQIALAGLLCSLRTTIGIALVILLAIVVLSQAQPLPLGAEPITRARIIHLGEVVSLGALTTFLAVFVSMYARRLEAARLEGAQNEKLAMLGRLVGAMSHELGTPLATILLASHDLADVSRELGDPEAERLAQTIEGEAQRASDIIGLVRGHIRPDLASERVELTAFVEKFATTELTRLGFRGRSVFDLPEPVSVSVLKPALGQVLLNVLTNAAEASARSPQPTITISVLRHDEQVEVVVEDSGPGFSDAILERVGEPFQTTKEAQGGMGLGLYVSSVLARRMNATLRVENAKSGGARVILSLDRTASLASPRWGHDAPRADSVPPGGRP